MTTEPVLAKAQFYDILARQTDRFGDSPKIENLSIMSAFAIVSEIDKHFKEKRDESYRY